MCDRPLSDDLLDWYDRHARKLPWRVPPEDRAKGIKPDPYRVWLSEIMLQQTTVAAVKDYFLKFTSLWPTVKDLAQAKDADVMAAWAGLGYYARARNLLKCARAVDAAGGEFPNSYEALITLPGVGPYTAAAISSIAFDQPETVLDGNVERVMARLHDIHSPLPSAKPKLKDKAAGHTPSLRAGDYAQAVMDLGATICTPRSPTCAFCPWNSHCEARKAGTQSELPKKTPKKPKPIRLGIAYIAQRSDGAFLLERRPDKGLLGGMLAWPCSDWSENPQADPPTEGDWRELPEEARHTFTHFHLRLKVMIATSDAEPKRGFFLPRHDFRPADLPTVMRKAWDLAAQSFQVRT